MRVETKDEIRQQLYSLRMETELAEQARAAVIARLRERCGLAVLFYIPVYLLGIYTGWLLF